MQLFRKLIFKQIGNFIIGSHSAYWDTFWVFLRIKYIKKELNISGFEPSVFQLKTQHTNFFEIFRFLKLVSWDSRPTKLFTSISRTQISVFFQISGRKNIFIFQQLAKFWHFTWWCGIKYLRILNHKYEFWCYLKNS